MVGRGARWMLAVTTLMTAVLALGVPGARAVSSVGFVGQATIPFGIDQVFVTVQPDPAGIERVYLTITDFCTGSGAAGVTDVRGPFFTGLESVPGQFHVQADLTHAVLDSVPIACVDIYDPSAFFNETVSATWSGVGPLQASMIGPTGVLRATTVSVVVSGDIPDSGSSATAWLAFGGW